VTVEREKDRQHFDKLLEEARKDREKAVENEKLVFLAKVSRLELEI